MTAHISESNQTQPTLQLSDISFHYEKDRNTQPILQNTNLSISEGEFVSIIGASGSGKTTIFRIIAGLESQSTGDVYLNGEIEKNRLGKVGYMPQQDLLLPWRTILQNATLPLEINKHNFKKADILHLLNEFGLPGIENKYPYELSGGMRQRVAFLRATLSGANLLLLDEPFSALDALTKLSLQEWLLSQWEKQQSTILFITHDITEALFLSDRILVLSESPVTEIKEIIVPLPRPRKLEDLDTNTIVEIKNSLIQQFKVKV